ncbi:MAG: tRNA (adenosine(37)-N6)-dimethylallyltransferase MiaA [Planctomycetes bacterium]|nr:tRNA (adenosine(37)-N6)-dimethylallyltransferase MiaA [Planctomycetota bacterium]MCP4772198.1 tRNA (adenosine(37)-N6)-dimethylallyltransferase MiaA [Planctomycetota bacterium]MCP4861254.1 tRNA (adenosine(37)-N6)-dimethylallyltransferase MiaA [Planctomycetota bacterium]
MTQRFFLLGPTASGKTAVALDLAGRLNAEILSLDSMLVYRGMDIGTAKPSAEEMASVPHHLIDLVEPSEEFSVARYLQAAAEAEKDVYARGKKVLYVGGTTMWFKALVFGLLDIPDAPQALQDELQRQWDRNGAADLYRELQQVDALAAEKIHPNDERRILRALGVQRSTGKALSAWQQQWQADSKLPEPAALLEWPREVLHQRVAQRFEGMVEAGLLGEIAAILSSGGFGRTAGKAIGYRQVLDHLEGKCSLEEGLQKAVTKTNVLIRRQMTWLRSFPDLLRIEMQQGEAGSEVAARLAAAWHA